MHMPKFGQYATRVNIKKEELKKKLIICELSIVLYLVSNKNKPVFIKEN